uniref:Uncharacterized protein n=1 Tax=Oryza punctata TaxID=4537 RepID=A0A0E0JXY7_ORYPU
MELLPITPRPPSIPPAGSAGVTAVEGVDTTTPWWRRRDKEAVAGWERGGEKPPPPDLSAGEAAVVGSARGSCHWICP